MVCYENIKVNEEIMTIVDIFENPLEIDTYSFKLYKNDKYIGFKIVKANSLDDALENLRFTLKYDNKKEVN